MLTRSVLNPSPRPCALLAGNGQIRPPNLTWTLGRSLATDRQKTGLKCLNGQETFLAEWRRDASKLRKFRRQEKCLQRTNSTFWQGNAHLAHTLEKCLQRTTWIFGRATDKFHFLAEQRTNTRKVPQRTKSTFWLGRAHLLRVAHCHQRRTVKPWPRSWLSNAPRTTANVQLAARLYLSVRLCENLSVCAN